MIRRLRSALVLALLAGVLGSGAARAADSTGADGRRTLTGTIDGADFRVEMPARWNGTLLLHSHGYLPPEFPEIGIALTNRPPGSESEAWLLEHGFALAASQFKEGGVRYQIENALQDQVALLDWFETHVDRPRRTVATGQSLGAAIALLLAERHPRRLDGVATWCGAPDPYGTFNAELDVNFAIKVLLAPGEEIELVRAANPERSRDLLAQAVQRALDTPQGRARLALAGALNNIPGWFSAHEPRPTELTAWIRAQASWILGAYIIGRGPLGRADIERRAGGNPLWNVGVDYRRQLARSRQTQLVRAAYRIAGVSLRRDLDRLAAAPRIAPDPQAVAYMYRFGVPTGRISAPVASLHSVGDGGAVADQDRWYAELVHRATGDPQRVRQLHVDRGMHCSFSAADEIVVLRALFDRMRTGHWPDTSAPRLNDEVTALGDPYQRVLDFGTFEDRPMPPAFTRYVAPRALRPAR